MKRKVLSSLLALTLLITMLSGCGQTKGTASGDKTAKPVKDSVVIALSADVSTLDPLHAAGTPDFMVSYNIYDDLISVDDKGNYVPNLAESWTLSQDGLSYTIKLKKGVKFHNGEELKAKDVVFTIDTALKSPYMAQRVGAIKNVEAIDDYTVKFNLVGPYAPFLISLYGLGIENEKAVKEAGEKYGENPVGTGAYKFVRHDKGQRVVLVRNDDYFKGPAKIKDVEFKVIIDPNTAMIAVGSGEIDLAFQVPMISLQSIKNNPKLVAHKFDTTNLAFLSMNNSIKPFNNPLVRQAISYAIDKDSIVQIATEGLAKKAESFLNKYTFGYSENVKGYEYNPEKAKELLTKAGYPNGFKTKLKTIDGILKKSAEVIQENLGKIGITVDIEMCEQGAFVKDTMSGNYEMSNLATSLPQDADFWGGYMFNSKSAMNFSKYNNPEVDGLFAQGSVITDKNQRLAIYEKIAQKINADAPIVPIYHSVNVYVGKKDLKLGYIDPSGGLVVGQMYWEK